MSKKTLRIIFILLLVSISVTLGYLWRHHRPYVIVSGEVTYDEFAKGEIEILWITKLNWGGPPNPHFPQGVVYMPKPGRYKLRIPKKHDSVYICARNKGNLHESFAYFISDPIKIRGDDIRDYDIVLKTKKILMDEYKGQTITLSGKVFCRKPKKGIIEVCVYSLDYYRKVRLPPDIAKVKLDALGDFSVDIPKNMGEICLMAVNIPEGEESGNSIKCQRGSYKNNPIIAGSADIENINITIN